MDKSLWALVPVDDTRIRKDSFKESKKIIHKMDRLEQALQNFYSTGQRLFNSWSELTFRGLREQLQKQEEEYIRLATRHNSIVTVSEMHNVPMWKAYKFILEEERVYQTATESEREQIEQMRQKREEFLKQQMHESFGFEDHVPPQEDVNEDQSTLQLEKIKELSLEQINQLLADKDLCLPFLMDVFKLCDENDEISFFYKIWLMTGAKNQKNFKRYFYQTYQEDLDAVLEEHGNYQTRVKSNQKPAVKTFDFESLKFIYRQLVQLLHPDRHSDIHNAKSLWMTRAWHQVQSAYKAKDKEGLERLLLTVRIRTDELSNLSVFEIRQSSVLLKDDLKILETKTKQIKKHPAWGFAIGRDRAKLEKKISDDLTNDIGKINYKIKEIESIHSQYAQIIDRNQMRGQPKRRRSLDYEREL